MNKKLIWTTLGCALLAFPLRADNPTALKSHKEQLSYSLGYNIGRQFKREQVEADPKAFQAGLRDALSGSTPQLTEKQISEAINQLHTEVLKKRQKQQAAASKKNLKEGPAFLAANKKKEGVVTLPDGLQYQVLRRGTGASPKPDDIVKVNYRGSLIDGTVFDSSYQRGKPVSFRLNQVISGWTEALQKMKVGGKWRLFIPPELGYGKRGAPPKIGPNAVLIFDVELLSIQPK